jgi:LacI family transcriptional regulator
MIRIRELQARKVLLAASIVPGESIRGIARFAREAGWHLSTDMMITGALPGGWRGDGVLASLPNRPELLDQIAASAVPAVALGCAGRADFPRVESDYGQTGRIAADHLIGRLHRSFAWAPFLDDAADAERLAAFRARLAEHGCTCSVLPPTHAKSGQGWLNEGGDCRQALLAALRCLPRPTAIFAGDDCVAAEIVDACREAGLAIPVDIAVLGVGDSISCTTSAVPISSVDLDLEEIGYRAAAMLERMMDRMDDQPSIRADRVPPKGVVTRISTDVVAVTNPRVSRVLSYIAEHYPDPMLSVATIASAVGMSRRNLERSFRGETGCTIHEHIITVRMQEASRLLKMCPQSKCSEVAALVGFGDGRTFFRTFRRYFGTSPREHREGGARVRRSDSSLSEPVSPLRLGESLLAASS